MRNKLAYSLGNSSVFSDGLKWTPSGQHVEVYLNDDYVGVYLLTQGIRIDPDRLNLKQMSADPAANDLDGGYIVEVDARLDCYNDGVINLQHHTPQGVRICIDTPNEEAITPMQLTFVKNLLDTVEQDVYGASHLDSINPASFADWYLLSELFRNNDAIFFSSDFMWKDTNAASNPLDRLLNMGPLWDFDISAGNVNYVDNWMTEGCWVTKSNAGMINWFAKLFDNREFLSLTLARWKQKRPALEKFVNSSIDTYSRRLALPQQRNFARWPIFGVQLTNYYMFANWSDEVAFLRSFLNQRMAWLDLAYANRESFNAMCK
jgi:CotH protein